MKSAIAKHSLTTASLIALAMARALPSTALAQEETVVEAAEGAEAATQTNAWGQVNIDLPADEAIRYGVLDNGMRYALRKNTTPKGAASVRMHVKVGSVAEAENEQGLAHFLEHMAFNGSTNVPEGEMVSMLEREGLSFGPDTNASTSFTETIYKLDLPDAKEAAVDLALMLMRETASNLTIGEEAVERERGVVQSERQLRNTAGLRSAVAQLAVQLPDTPVSKRLPIGTVEVVDTAPASRIRDFYHRYYRPENTTLVLVGDFDTNAMEAKIKAQFADWEAVGPAGKPMDYGTIDPASPLTIGSFNDPSAQTTAIFQKAKPYEATGNSVAANLESVQLALASQIISQRFQKLTLSADAKILGGAAPFVPVENIAEQGLFVSVGKAGDWQSAVAVGEQELRRALQHGFTQSEVDEQLANLSANLENTAKQQDTRRNAGVADEIISSSVSGEIVLTPASKFEVLEALKPALTADQVTEAFRANWAGGPNNVFVTTAEPIENAGEAIAAALTASQKVAVEAPVEAVTKPFAYDDFGTPGKISSDTMIEDLGIRTITFENGVRLNIKTTDFEAGKVRYSVKVGEGLQSIPEGSGGLNYFMENVMALGGLGEHDIEEIQKLTVGKSVNIAMRAGQDALTSSGTTTPDDAELQFKLLAALVTDPGYRMAADSLWQNALPTINTQNSATPIAVFRRDFSRVMASGDPRIGQGSPEEIGAMNMAKVKKLISNQLDNGQIDIAIVGDVEEQAAIDMVAQTFGALPERQTSGDGDKTIRPVNFPKDAGTITLYHNGQADQGAAAAVWPTDDYDDQKDDVTRDIMSAAMGLILTDEVRENLSASYSTEAFSRSSSIYDGDGFVTGFAVADPARMDEIYAAIRTAAKQLRDAPVADDLLLRARKPMLERLDAQDRSNGAWLGAVVEAQRRSERLDRWRGRKEIAASVTAADIQAAAQKYLKDDAMVEVRIIPKPDGK
ncbi:MAG: insulinase family protein [Erythrobacter sp.]